MPVSLARRILYNAGETGIPRDPSVQYGTIEKRSKGSGRVKAIQISCISELAKRLAKASYSNTLCFSRPDTIARYYMEDLRHEKQEVMKLLMLNSKAKTDRRDQCFKRHGQFFADHTKENFLLRRCKKTQCPLYLCIITQAVIRLPAGKIC